MEGCYGLGPVNWSIFSTRHDTGTSMLQPFQPGPCVRLGQGMYDAPLPSAPASQHTCLRPQVEQGAAKRLAKSYFHGSICPVQHTLVHAATAQTHTQPYALLAPQPAAQAATVCIISPVVLLSRIPYPPTGVQGRPRFEVVSVAHPCVGSTARDVVRLAHSHLMGNRWGTVRYRARMTGAAGFGLGFHYAIWHTVSTGQMQAVACIQ